MFLLSVRTVAAGKKFLKNIILTDCDRILLKWRVKRLVLTVFQCFPQFTILDILQKIGNTSQ